MATVKPKKKKSSKRSSKKIWIILSVLLIGVAFGSIAAWFYIFRNNVKSEPSNTYVYIKTGSNFNMVCDSLNNHLDDISSFERVANWMGYTEKVKPGRYRIRKGMSNIELVRLLRSGIQEPVHVVMKTVHVRKDLAAQISLQLEANQQELDSMLNSQAWCQSQGFDTSKIMAMFIPDTYYFNWNSSAHEFMQRMKAAYDKFWNEDRREKAKKLNLKPWEIVTLASIIKGETEQKEEMPRIAGVFINRLKKNMPLEADPTIEFAWQDFGIRRVLKKHLEIESPYNTYRHSGLPPGPICNPPASTIDAMLSPEKHSYLFYCADLDRPGFHAFSTTYSAHLMHAREYQRRRFRNT